jgi:hypothetical protein
MAKADIDAKIQKLRKVAEEKIRARYEAQIEREIRAVEDRARKYFESQEDPDVSMFLGEGPRRRGASGNRRRCSVCQLEGTRNTFTGAKKKDHTRAEHEHLRAS